MVSTSKGPRRKTRSKFKGAPKFSVNKFLRKFETGQKVTISIDSSSHSAMPFKRFIGLTGKVLDKRGDAYIIQIKDGNKPKKLIIKPEHLRSI